MNNNKLYGFRFKAQHPISQFIADFYCHKASLVIEIDGEIHNFDERKEYDEGRTYEIEKFGLKVIRFSNKAITENINDVLNEIKLHLCAHTP